MPPPEPLNLRRLRVFPLAERRSLSRLDDVLIDPDRAPSDAPHSVVESIGQCAEQIVLSLSPGIDRTDKVIKQLSRAADVRLEYLRSSSPNQ